MDAPRDEQGRYIITRAEWNAKHADFKLTASQSQDGEPYVLKLNSATGGTELVPVVIVG